MSKRVVRMAAAAVLLLAIGAVLRNQVKVYRRGVARSAEMRQRQSPPTLPPGVAERRQALFAALQPVTIRNCALERFGGRGDGGYLLCGNLLGEVESGYSYGIGGHDDWGCGVSASAEVVVHQYDCFNLERPWCWRGETVFHEECVAGRATTMDGRTFDTVARQVARNGDTGKRLVVKIDVEGAEWDSLLALPDDLLQQIDQMAIEFHWSEDQQLGWADDPRYLAAVEHLKRFMVVGHVHFNNMNCVGNLAPFPASAFEVLFVNRRLATVDATTRPTLPHALDSPTRWWVTDCQVSTSVTQFER